MTGARGPGQSMKRMAQHDEGEERQRQQLYRQMSPALPLGEEVHHAVEADEGVHEADRKEHAGEP